MTIQEIEPYIKAVYWTLGSISFVYFIRIARRYL